MGPLIDEARTSGLASEARRVPLVQSSVADFASRHTADELSAAFVDALGSAGAHAATVLAIAAAHRGAKLDPEAARRLLPELDSISLFGPLVLAAAGDRIELLIRFLDDGSGAWEREALAILLAVELLSDQPPPPRLLTHARKLARKSLGTMAACVFGAAASRFEDPHLVMLAGNHIALARGQHRVAASMLEGARSGPLDALPTAPPPRVSSGYTIRKAAPEVGRNDPCPCGSGKKYKKCCANKVEVAQAEPAPIDPSLLTLDQVDDLRPSAIVELDPNRLSRLARIAGYRKLLTYRRWSAAERFHEAISRELDSASSADWREELVDAAIHARAHDVVERHVAKLPADRHSGRLQILTECIRRPPDLLDRLEGHARAALEDERGETLLSLAYAMLDYYPALGIILARGALSKERPFDSFTVLEAIEEARDELGIAPFEPWWDIWEQISEAPDRSAMNAAEREKVEKITGDLRRAREKADEAAAEARRLQEKLLALESATSKVSSMAASVVPAGDASALEEAAKLTAERKRLRTKVEELQRIVSQGQDERRDLRQRLAQATTAPASSPAASSEEVAEPNDDAGDHGGDPVEQPRRVLVPVFAPRASSAIAELPAGTAELVLVLVAELAAGRENVWSGVKRLRVRSVLSARAGIHYRVLFSVSDGALHVAHVIHRRDLEQAITSLE